METESAAADSEIRSAGSKDSDTRSMEAPGRWAQLQYAWRGWLLAALFAVLAWARFRSQAPLEPAWLALIAAGAGYRLQAARYIPGHSNSIRLAGDTPATGGPYRIGRHPLYLSNLAVIAGLIGYAHCLPPWGGLLLWGLAALHHDLLARTEERHLARVLGEEYLEYMRVTPRWISLPQARAAEGPASRSAASGTAPRISSGLAAVWRRQAGNLFKTSVPVILLWALARAAR